MEVRIKAWKTKSVSARQLARNVGRLMNEIEDSGEAVVVIRFGRPAALMVPIERNRAPRGFSIEAVVEQPPGEMELDEHQRLLLSAMARCAPEPYSPNSWTGDISNFMRSFVKLEMGGLVEKDRAGRRWLTEEGERAAARLPA